MKTAMLIIVVNILIAVIVALSLMIFVATRPMQNEEEKDDIEFKTPTERCEHCKRCKKIYRYQHSTNSVDCCGEFHHSIPDKCSSFKLSNKKMY